MRLWNKSFGKETKVKDFAGRIMAKGAYNDRNSECGWNVDHILPQSKGGTTADHNLVCCHILTNDEKADKFPCFNANGISFEIIKVQNHYEIRLRNNTHKKENHAEDYVDFYDSASGLRFFKKRKGMQNKGRFVGTVLVRLGGISNNAVIDFIEKLFEKENTSFKKPSVWNSWDKEICIIIRNCDMPLKDDMSELLDQCVLLNTYLSSYFLECGYINGFEIYYRVDYFADKTQMFGQNCDFAAECASALKNTMFVNELVLENTEAGEKAERVCDYSTILGKKCIYAKYNFVFTRLSENLIKEANGK